MAIILFLLAAITFAVKVFGGNIGELDLIALGLTFLAIGFIVGGGVPAFIRTRKE